MDTRSRCCLFALVALACSQFGCPIYASGSPDDAPAGEPRTVPAVPVATSALDRKLTVATDGFDGAWEPDVETDVGDLVADALLDRYRAVGAQMVFLNSGAFSGGLPSYYAPSDPTVRHGGFGDHDGPPYDVVVGDVLTLYPYADHAVVRSLDAKTIYAMLENGVSQVVDGAETLDGRFPQIAGFHFVFDPTQPPGQRITRVVLDDGSVEITPDSGGRFTVVVNDYMDGGGDGYSMLVDGADHDVRGTVQDVLTKYLAAQSTIAPNESYRIFRFD